MVREHWRARGTEGRVPSETRPLGLGDLVDLYQPEWMRRGACRVADPTAFYADEFNPDSSKPGTGWQATALAVCASCPVIAECGQYADDHKIRDSGIWGGKFRQMDYK